MRHIFALIIGILLAIPACAQVGNLDNVSTMYDPQEKKTIVYPHEKLIDAHTAIGGGYAFPGHHMSGKLTDVSLTLFGYHDIVLWKGVESVTLTYGRKAFTATVFYSLHGEDRDKNSDLAEGKYFETMVMPLPPDVAAEVFASDGVDVSGPPIEANIHLTAADMDRCRDLLASVDVLRKIPATTAQTIAESANGLPVDRTVDGSSGDAVLATSLTALSPRFAFQVLGFIEENHKRVKKPGGALLIAEVDDTPAMENDKVLDVTYGHTKLRLTSNVGHTQDTPDNNRMTVRTYLLTNAQINALAKAPSLSLRVGSVRVSVPHAKMAGLAALAKKMK
jgi:hypothetical protein